MVLAGAGAFATHHLMQAHESVLSSIPKRPKAQAEQGILSEKLADEESRARSYFHGPAGLRSLARVYQANGFSNEAIAAYRGLLNTTSATPQDAYLFACLLGDFGQLDDAAPLLQRVIRLAPDYLPAKIRLAEIALKTNRPETAEQLWRTVLESDPKNFSAALGLAQLELNAGRADQARQRVHDILRDSPKYTPAWDVLAAIEDQAGNVNEANVARAKSRELGRTRAYIDPWLDALLDDCVDPYSLRVAAATRATDSPNLSVELLKRAIAFAPYEATTYRQLGKLLRDLDRPDEARPFLDRAVILDPTSSENWSFLADLLNAQNDFSAANKTIVAGLTHCPNSSSLHLLRGRQLRREGQLELAAAEFRRVCELRPEEIDGRIDLAGIYLRQCRWDETEEELLKALKIEADEPGALGALTRFYIFRKNQLAAARCMERVHRQKRMPKEMVSALDQAFSEQFRSPSEN